MSIQTFPKTTAGFAAANAVVGSPKHIWVDANRIVVYTGTDATAQQPVLTQDETDSNDARNYAKLKALMAMTPAQVQAWVDANVTNLATAQDALKTLAIAVGILARKVL